MILNITLNGNVSIVSDKFVSKEFADYLTNLLNGKIINTTEKISEIIGHGICYIELKTSKNNELTLYFCGVNGDGEELTNNIYWNLYILLDIPAVPEIQSEAENDSIDEFIENEQFDDMLGEALEED